MSEQVFGDGGAGADHQRVVAADDLAQFVLGKTGLDVDVDILGSVEDIESVVAQLVRDEHTELLFRHGNASL